MKSMTGSRIGMGLAALVFTAAGSLALAQDAAQTKPSPPPAHTNGPGYEKGFQHHRPPMERAVGPRDGHGPWWNNPFIIEKLKLSDTQRKGIEDIVQQHRIKLVDLHADLEKDEIILSPLLDADQPDETQILAQIDKVAAARAELEKANARMLLGIRRQLTPDQWKQLGEDKKFPPHGLEGDHPQGPHGSGFGPGGGSGPGFGEPGPGGPPHGGGPESL